ncbi:MAG TPA: GlsB/YeaQ/YmgE family stress response membrane protein [Acidimicrobiia bacterium]|nr:GlsB/YeaQ/YmgE family stress response membrane protein [Acidimicrobiia bacterium]
MENTWDVIWQGLLAGVIVGPLARLVLPGDQNMSLIMTILFGAVGAIGGGLLYVALGGGETSGIDWWRLITQVAVAAVVILIMGRVFKAKPTAT